MDGLVEAPAYQYLTIGRKRYTDDIPPFSLKGSDWEGMFDEMLLFDVALGEEDIQMLMENGLEATLAVEPVSKLTTNWGKIKLGRTQSR